MSVPSTAESLAPQLPPTFALGLGLTNECNLACAFCYRDPSRVDRLTLEQVRAVMARLPVRSVNLGTGENGLHPEFLAVLGYLRSQPVKLTMTTNGYSVASISDEQLIAFKDIEFSLDYPNEAEQDRQRGPDNWQLLHEQAARCRRLGVPVTFIAVMMQSNFDRLAEIAAIAKAYAAPLKSTSTSPCGPTSSLSPTSSIGSVSRGCSSKPTSSPSESLSSALWRAFPPAAGAAGSRPYGLRRAPRCNHVFTGPVGARRSTSCSMQALTWLRQGPSPMRAPCPKHVLDVFIWPRVAVGVQVAGG